MNFVIWLACDDIGKRRLARTVRAHDGGDFTIVNGEVQAVEDFLVFDRDVEIANFKYGGGPWNGVRGVGSTDRAFERNGDEFLGFDSELHRELLQHVLHEAVDDERSRLFFRKATLHAVEELLF